MFDAVRDIGDVEFRCAEKGMDFIIGVDEVGTGPMAGPVTACAVMMNVSEAVKSSSETGWVSKIDDSKKINESQRKQAKTDLELGSDCIYSIVSRPSEHIENNGIVSSSISAMTEAVENVLSESDVGSDLVVVDGNKKIEGLPYNQVSLIGGDGLSYAVAAASILAKIDRDKFMKGLHSQWPEYNFESNKGYGTREHRNAIEEHGPCIYHRMTYKGVREYSDRLRSDD